MVPDGASPFPEPRMGALCDVAKAADFQKCVCSECSGVPEGDWGKKKKKESYKYALRGREEFVLLQRETYSVQIM